MAFWGKSLYSLFISVFGNITVSKCIWHWVLGTARFKGLDWVILHDRSYQLYTMDTITDTVSFQANILFYSIQLWRAQSEKASVSFQCALRVLFVLLILSIHIHYAVFPHV
jgi:hypothetical protein